MSTTQPSPDRQPHPDQRPFPGGQTFSDVVVVPYAALLDRWQDDDWHRGGPIWPDWDTRTDARHCRGGEPIDVHPDPPATEPTPVEALAWGGGIDIQFGHQVADFSARLLPTMRARPELPIAFGIKTDRGWRTFEDTPGFFRAILDWFGLAPDRIRLIDEPALVAELFVAPQAEQLDGPGPGVAYLDALDDNADRRLGRPDTRHDAPLYVSRAGMDARFAGEAYLEGVLAATGVRIMRPETMPLIEQLRAYRESHRIVFAEGSAVHVLQLLGRLDAEVGVLVRRGGKRLARPNLLPRVRDLRYADATSGILVGLAPSGRWAHHRGLSLLDEEAVPEALARLGLDISRVWEPAAFRGARDEDALAWIDAQVRDTERHGSGSVEHILEGLQTNDLGHLADEASRRLQPLREHLAARSARVVSPDPAGPTLLFMHFPRTAGGAFRSVLEDVIPEPQRCYVYDHLPVEGAITADEFAGLPEGERSGLALVMGDFDFGFHQHIPGPARYVTALRHPVSRVISLYAEAARGAAERGENLPPLEEWVFGQERLEADNAMVRAIAGRHDPPFGACTDDMLTDALAHIEAHFEAVLSRGSMTRSLVVLGKVVGVPLPVAPVVNAGPTIDEEDIGGDLRKRLRDLNRLDVALFRRFADAL